MFYNNEKFNEFKKSQKKTDIEKFGIILVLILAYASSGTASAVVIGIGSIIWLLSDIKKSLSYQNLMTEKKIGIHDLKS
jgi:hypothetical protein